MRVFVTGASGFVGRHVLKAFAAAGHDIVAAGGPHDTGIAFDIEDAQAVAAAMGDARPDCIVHLAAQTFVPAAVASPEATQRINVGGTRNVLDAAAHLEGAPHIIFASSAEVYGAVEAEHLPIRETQPLAPRNPYAQSKADAEALVRASALPATIVRSFNAIGAGQDERFVVPSFAGQLARIARGGEPVMYVGNLEAKRDFIDVRDVAAAYLALAQSRITGTFNVCSGNAYAVRDVLRELILLARVPVEVREDPERMRPSDIPLFVGSNAALVAATGWKPQRSLRATLRDVYEAALENVEK